MHHHFLFMVPLFCCARFHIEFGFSHMKTPILSACKMECAKRNSESHTQFNYTYLNAKNFRCISLVFFFRLLPCNVSQLHVRWRRWKPFWICCGCVYFIYAVVLCKSVTAICMFINQMPECTSTFMQVFK